jgi:hypothetical protein
MGKKITRRPDPLGQSKAYPLAVNIARGASKYEELEIDGKLVHFVYFEKSRADAGRAQALVRYISGWKGVQVFAGGRLAQNTWRVVEVLDCYLSACGCTDWKAHCFKVVDDPFIDEPEDQSLSFSVSIDEPAKPKRAVTIDRFIFPCSLLHPRFRFQIDHPSTPEAQIQAAAVRMSYDWCPKFEAGAYEKVGTRTILKDLFE